MMNDDFYIDDEEECELPESTYFELLDSMDTDDEDTMELLFEKF